MSELNPVHVDELTPCREWWEEHGKKLFPRFSAVEFFIKRHRSRLVAEGAFIPGKGARPSMFSTRIDTLIPQMWLEEAVADPKNHPRESSAA